MEHIEDDLENGLDQIKRVRAVFLAVLFMDLKWCYAANGQPVNAAAAKSNKQRKGDRVLY